MCCMVQFSVLLRYVASHYFTLTSILSHHVLQVIEQLLSLQYQRLKTIDEDFSAKMKALDEEFSGERSEINAAHARHKKDMNDIIVAMQSQFSELEADLRQVCLL